MEEGHGAADPQPSRLKEQIVRQMLKEGFLISPEDLEKAREADLEHMLEKAKAAGTVVFSISGEPQQARRFEVRKFHRKQKLSPQDFAAHYNARFEGLKGLLLKKMENVVSVGNAKKSSAPVSTIGMVREQTQRGFMIEDTTGEAEVISKSDEARSDDVIGVRGAVKEGKIFAEEIMWPDVPLSHESSRPDIRLTLSGKADHKDEVGRKASKDAFGPGFLITPEAVYGFDRKKTQLPNPGWITITSDEPTITVLVYRPDKPAAPKEAISWLKRRRLPADKNQIAGTDDPFLIEPVPDVLWIVQKTEKEGERKTEGVRRHLPTESAFKPVWSESYKGVIMVSTDGSVPATVSLETGDVKFHE